MVVTFDPIVKVRNIDVSMAEHIQEIKNPQNMIEIVQNDQYIHKNAVDQAINDIINPLPIMWILTIVFILIMLVTYGVATARRKKQSQHNMI